jgi:hypothetical protein
MAPHLQNQTRVTPQLLKPDTGGPPSGFYGDLGIRDPRVTLSHLFWEKSLFVVPQLLIASTNGTSSPKPDTGDPSTVETGHVRPLEWVLERFRHAGPTCHSHTLLFSPLHCPPVFPGSPLSLPPPSPSVPPSAASIPPRPVGR